MPRENLNDRDATDSIESSDIHLETVRALKMINSLLATVAYPILAESGRKALDKLEHETPAIISWT